MIQATPNPPSPFHSSHMLFKLTDPSASLSNNSKETFGSPLKKRKITERGNEVENSSTLPVAFASSSEGTYIQVHKIIKRECEELIELIVHLSIFMPFLSAYSDINTGSSQIMDGTFIVKVSEDTTYVFIASQTPYSIARLVGSLSLFWTALTAFY